MPEVGTKDVCLKHGVRLPSPRPLCGVDGLGRGGAGAPFLSRTRPEEGRSGWTQPKSVPTTEIFNTMEKILCPLSSSVHGVKRSFRVSPSGSDGVRTPSSLEEQANG